MNGEVYFWHLYQSGFNWKNRPVSDMYKEIYYKELVYAIVGIG